MCNALAGSLVAIVELWYWVVRESFRRENLAKRQRKDVIYIVTVSTWAGVGILSFSLSFFLSISFSPLEASVSPSRPFFAHFDVFFGCSLVFFSFSSCSCFFFSNLFLFFLFVSSTFSYFCFSCSLCSLVFYRENIGAPGDVTGN